MIDLFSSLALWIRVEQLLSRHPGYGWIHSWIWNWPHRHCLVYCSRTQIKKDFVSSILFLNVYVLF